MTTPNLFDESPGMNANRSVKYFRRVHAGINIYTGLPEKHIALVEPCQCDIDPLEVNEYQDVMKFCTETTLFEPLQHTPAMDGRCHAGFDPDTLEFFCHEIPEPQKSCRCKYLPIEYDYENREISEEDTYWGYIARLNAKVKKYNMQAVPRWFSKAYAQTLHPDVEGEMELIFGPIEPNSYAQNFCTIFVAIEGSAAQPIDLTGDDLDDDVYETGDEPRSTIQLGDYRNPPAPGHCRCRSCESYDRGGCDYGCGKCFGPCEVTGKFVMVYDDDDEHEEDSDDDKTVVGSPRLEIPADEETLAASVE
ncbi:hypothetical protein H2200_000131 [Cladophialophora chaetospira]|uniref:Uncharacterized protein n=1 Tax=Cladophialophora chaetospira TaxID=386627 RepID=A0AA38XMV3_9EURO|nr:hypothetical protein H2200_000131 [Cladophialophora chaetospira]